MRATGEQHDAGAAPERQHEELHHHGQALVHVVLVLVRGAEHVEGNVGRSLVESNQKGRGISPLWNQIKREAHCKTRTWAKRLRTRPTGVVSYQPGMLNTRGVSSFND